MPNIEVEINDDIVVDTDVMQIRLLGMGCPQGNIYDGSDLQPTRQGLRSQSELKGE